ncbi:MAG: C40 family peptidase [Hyphomicrobiales bacterium]|nr:C40 family peptidase [Hyphomicrobiales bacterium]
MSAASKVTRADIVLCARRWLGTPYQHQASLIHVGCDCLGLVRGIWRELIGPEPETPPPYSADWAEVGGIDTLQLVARRYLQPGGKAGWQAGDVLLFRWRAHLPAKHLAIVTARDMMIHAHDGAAVAEVALSPFWLRHLDQVFAFPGLTV